MVVAQMGPTMIPRDPATCLPRVEMCAPSVLAESHPLELPMLAGQGKASLLYQRVIQCCCILCKTTAPAETAPLWLVVIWCLYIVCIFFQSLCKALWNVRYTAEQILSHCVVCACAFPAGGDGRQRVSVCMCKQEL